MVFAASNRGGDAVGLAQAQRRNVMAEDDETPTPTTLRQVGSEGDARSRPDIQDIRLRGLFLPIMRS